MKIKGAFLDTSILCIADYLLKINATDNLDYEINYLLSKYNFVPKDNKENLKNDIKNAYKYKSEMKTKSIDSLEFAKFKIDTIIRSKAEEELIMELKMINI